ncbi:MAG: hypothetical protein B6245_00035 [Desulfobacteraceae bacterium 4572_88]|nr:MAG: hypothetical protein B6245_00035 [Desulfobacteraceae bacterium 4572_88]
MANPFTETVIGTERISMILQNAPSVFDTTDYRFLIRFVRESAIQTNLSPAHPRPARTDANASLSCSSAGY